MRDESPPAYAPAGISSEFFSPVGAPVGRHDRDVSEDPTPGKRAATRPDAMQRDGLDQPIRRHLIMYRVKIMYILYRYHCRSPYTGHPDWKHCRDTSYRVLTGMWRLEGKALGPSGTEVTTVTTRSSRTNQKALQTRRFRSTRFFFPPKKTTHDLDL